MHETAPSTPPSPPVEAGQLRADRNACRIRVHEDLGAGRFAVSYPGLTDKSSALSAVVIEAHYPTVLRPSDARGGGV